LRIDEVQSPKIRVTTRSRTGSSSKDSVHVRSGRSVMARIRGRRRPGQKVVKLGMGKKRDAIGIIVKNSIGTSCRAKGSEACICLFLIIR
jgi:hypothetical protein